MKKILMWIGGRANYGRLKPLIMYLNANYQVYLIFGDYILPDNDKLGNNVHILGTVPNLLYNDTKANSAISTSLVTQSCITLCQDTFDIAIVHGDRFENLGFAIACSYKGIPLLHIEGGDISGQIDNKVRNAISALSDIHCATTEESTSRLRIRGYNAYNTGSPAIDYVKMFEDKNRPVEIGDFVLSLFNPSDDDDLDEYIKAIEQIGMFEKIFWISPNNDPGWREITKKLHSNSNIIHLNNLPPHQYYSFLRRCKCLMGNTSSGIKEGGYFGVPYILVGTRQLGREVGPNVKSVLCQKWDIVNAVLEIPKGLRYEYTGIFGNGEACKEISYVVERVIGQ